MQHDLSQAPAPEPSAVADDLRATTMALLDEHRTMAVATLRPDGWPQTTIVGYVHDGFDIYFAVSRDSQKLTNILRDPRVSLALGHQLPQALRGLSIAGRAVELNETAEIERLNRLMHDKYPGESPLAPRERSTAVLRVTPEVLSVIDVARDSGRPSLVRLRDGELIPYDDGPARGALAKRRDRDWFASSGDFYRPGAPL